MHDLALLRVDSQAIAAEENACPRSCPAPIHSPATLSPALTPSPDMRPPIMSPSPYAWLWCLPLAAAGGPCCRQFGGLTTASRNRACEKDGRGYHVAFAEMRKLHGLARSHADGAAPSRKQQQQQRWAAPANTEACTQGWPVPGITVQVTRQAMGIVAAMLCRWPRAAARGASGAGGVLR